MNLRELITNVFADLRGLAPAMGIGELLDALRLADSGRDAELREDVRLLWCRSSVEEQEFDRLWREHESRLTPAETSADSKAAQSETAQAAADREALRPETYIPPAPATATAEREGPREPSVSAIPIKSPSSLISRSTPIELNGYWPISARSIEYGWQYLRRPRNDGPATVLDVTQTVEAIARQGVLLAPVYRKSSRNHAHLVLLIDRRGSMTPFHALTGNVVNTARRAERDGILGRLDVIYFQNVAEDNLYADPKLSELLQLKTKRNQEAPVTLDQAMAVCTRDTAILIVSDAGAARGHRHQGRIAATEEMLHRLSRRANRIAWLNPMPQSRWAGTSARIISLFAPMFEMNKLGFNDAIRRLRG